MTYLIERRLLKYGEMVYGSPMTMTFSPDKTIMFISTPWDNFKIYLKDKERFGFYTLAHQNKQNLIKKLVLIITLMIITDLNKMLCYGVIIDVLLCYCCKC